MRSLVVSVLLVALAVAGYVAARYWQDSRQHMQLLNAGAGCDLGVAACTHDLPGGGKLTLDVDPRPVPLMQRVAFRLQVNDPAVEPVYLEITGLNMEMGVNRVSLSTEGQGEWRGETIVPICSQRRMHWRAALVIRRQGKLFRLVDQFYTSRP